MKCVFRLFLHFGCFWSVYILRNMCIKCYRYCDRYCIWEWLIIYMVSKNPKAVSHSSASMCLGIWNALKLLRMVQSSYVTLRLLKLHGECVFLGAFHPKLSEMCLQPEIPFHSGFCIGMGIPIVRNHSFPRCSDFLELWVPQAKPRVYADVLGTKTHKSTSFLRVNVPKLGTF